MLKDVNSHQEKGNLLLKDFLHAEDSVLAGVTYNKTTVSAKKEVDQFDQCDKNSSSSRANFKISDEFDILLTK